MATKRVLAIHDLCSFGRCSLTAAIPVISAMGSQVCPFPTALFSNNFTYGDFTFSDFSEKMTGFMDKWQQLVFYLRLYLQWFSCRRKPNRNCSRSHSPIRKD